MENSKAIDILKVDEKKTMKELNVVRDEITKIVKQLEERLGKVTFAKEVKKQRVKRDNQSIISRKVELVEQKIAKGEKLTTEDLMILQSADN